MVQRENKNNQLYTFNFKYNKIHHYISIYIKTKIYNMHVYSRDDIKYHYYYNMV